MPSVYSEAADASKKRPRVDADAESREAENRSAWP
jgi:hypothetical protein